MISAWSVIYLRLIYFVINPSWCVNKDIVGIARVFQSRTAQLADFFGRAEVVWETGRLSVALLNTRKPFHADITLKHVAIKQAVLDCKTRATNTVIHDKCDIQWQIQAKHNEKCTKFLNDSQNLKGIFRWARALKIYVNRFLQRAVFNLQKFQLNLLCQR